MTDDEKIQALVAMFPGVSDEDLLAGYKSWQEADAAPEHVRRAVLDAAEEEINRRGLKA